MYLTGPAGVTHLISNARVCCPTGYKECLSGNGLVMPKPMRGPGNIHSFLLDGESYKPGLATAQTSIQVSRSEDKNAVFMCVRQVEPWHRLGEVAKRSSWATKLLALYLNNDYIHNKTIIPIACCRRSQLKLQHRGGWLLRTTRKDGLLRYKSVDLSTILAHNRVKFRLYFSIQNDYEVERFGAFHVFRHREGLSWRKKIKRA